jgi:WS/DGAT/MGAT family acyltransferase
MKLLTGLDAAFLDLETPEMPMHVGALQVFERPRGDRTRFVKRLREHMAERLPLAPQLRRRLWWPPLKVSNPAWVDAEPDLDWHITSVTLPPEAKDGDGMAVLEAEIGRLHPERLDRERPLWRMWVLEGLAPSAEGLPRVALYTQFHHAAVDGKAAVALGQALLDPAPSGRELALRPSSRAKVYSLGGAQMLRGAVAAEAGQIAQITRQIPETVGALAQALGAAWKLRRSAKEAKPGEAAPSNIGAAPRTRFNANVGTERAFATLSLPLPALKAAGKQLGATINDVVLWLCATALRDYLGAHGGLPKKSLVAAMPFSLGQGKGSANDVSMSAVSLGTHLADPAKRLAHIKAATAAMKATLGSLKSVLPTDFPSMGVPWLLPGLARLYTSARVAERLPAMANVVISNVPGPPVPLFLAGARLTANYPTSIVVHGVALNITLQSYAGQLDFGFIADPVHAPDLRALAAGVGKAFEQLQAMAQAASAPPAQARPTAAATRKKVAPTAAPTPKPKAAPKAKTSPKAASKAAPKAAAPRKTPSRKTAA